MHNFHAVIELINELIYHPNHLIMDLTREEPQNSGYAAGEFTLSSQAATRTIRFRVAKTTPTKIGQFVTFWEKDSSGINQPFQYDESPNLLVVTTFKDKNTFGQFVFPKNTLLKKGILKSDSIKGKMGVRVYPSWETPTSRTAIKTQEWQLKYFFEVNENAYLPIEKIIALYHQ